MDRTNNFLNEFQSWISPMDEAYLIGIANRGLYNRALKELAEKPAVRVEYRSDQLTCTLPDGTACSLTNDLQKLSCSCPARGICKHLLLCLLYLRQNTQRAVPESEARVPADFSSLLEVLPRDLRKLCGDKAYADCVSRLDFGIEAEVAEGTLLVVSFKGENTSVRFPPQDPLKNAICSCKSAEFCRHKAEALIHYQLAKGVVNRQDLVENKGFEIPGKILTDVKRLLEEILELGLSRAPETMLDNLEQAAVLAHSADLANVERQLRALKGELELYFAKVSAFSRESARKRVSELYCTLLALEGPKPDLRLVGEHKSSYFDIPPQEFYGLGAEGWRTKSGYEGITYYFFSAKLKRWLTYTNARPTYYEDSKVSFTRMYKSAPPWNVAGTSQEFSKSRLSLVHGKINVQGRLSASEQAVGTILGLTRVEELDDLSGFSFNIWAELLDSLAQGLAYSLFEAEENFNLVLLKPTKWGQGNFDTINQMFSLPLYDPEGRQIEISIQFNSQTSGLISRLEQLEKTGRYPEMLLGRVSVKEGLLRVFPISAFFGHCGLVNLTLEES